MASTDDYMKYTDSHINYGLVRTSTDNAGITAVAQHSIRVPSRWTFLRVLHLFLQGRFVRYYYSVLLSGLLTTKLLPGKYQSVDSQGFVVFTGIADNAGFMWARDSTLWSG